MYERPQQMPRVYLINYWVIKIAIMSHLGEKTSTRALSADTRVMSRGPEYLSLSSVAAEAGATKLTDHCRENAFWGRGVLSVPRMSMRG